MWGVILALQASCGVHLGVDNVVGGLDAYSGMAGYLVLMV